MCKGKRKRTRHSAKGARGFRSHEGEHTRHNCRTRGGRGGTKVVLTLVILIFTTPLVGKLFNKMLKVLIALTLLPFLLAFFTKTKSVVLIVNTTTYVIIKVTVAISLPPTKVLAVNVKYLVVTLKLLLLLLAI